MSLTSVNLDVSSVLEKATILIWGRSVDQHILEG